MNCNFKYINQCDLGGFFLNSVKFEIVGFFFSKNETVYIQHIV